MATPGQARLLTKKQQQGENSRELILDATERLMATRGYAATSMSDIRKACGLPPSSIYWHFGSKEGVLAAVMERGADRFFASIPIWDQADVPAEQRSERQLTVLAGLQSQHPDFLRLFYMLSLERSDDPAVARVVRRVRDTAIERVSRRDQPPASAGHPGPEGRARRLRADRIRGRALGRRVLRRTPRTRRDRRRADVPAPVAGRNCPYPNPSRGATSMKTAIITGGKHRARARVRTGTAARDALAHCPRRARSRAGRRRQWSSWAHRSDAP